MLWPKWNPVGAVGVRLADGAAVASKRAREIVVNVRIARDTASTDRERLRCGAERERDQQTERLQHLLKPSPWDGFAQLRYEPVTRLNLNPATSVIP
jgi:hypothetical protein